MPSMYLHVPAVLGWIWPAWIIGLVHQVFDHALHVLQQPWWFWKWLMDLSSHHGHPYHPSPCTIMEASSVPTFAQATPRTALYASSIGLVLESTDKPTAQQSTTRWLLLLWPAWPVPHPSSWHQIISCFPSFTIAAWIVLSVAATMIGLSIHPTGCSLFAAQQTITQEWQPWQHTKQQLELLLRIGKRYYII